MGLIDRRTFGLGLGAGLGIGLAGVSGSATAAADATTVRVASLKFGSLSWLLDTIKHDGIDTKHGVKIDVLDVANNQAGPVALLAGEADVIVSDWTWALRQRASGLPLRFSPFSNSLGSLMVPPGSAVKTLADLDGKKLGVAGTAIDKSWLLLRAYSRKTLGRDVMTFARPVFGAPPLVTEELRAGRLDAVLNFWTYAAKLSGGGYVQLLTIADVLKALEIDPPPPLVGFLWSEKTAAEKGPAIKAFLNATVEGNAVLAASDEAWARIRPLVKPESEAEFTAVKKYYRAGIPGAWSLAQTKSAEKLVGVLAGLGEADLLGDGTRFDAKLFPDATG